MIIQRIKIENFDDIDRLEVAFKPDVTHLKGDNAMSIVKAVGVILQNEEVMHIDGFCSFDDTTKIKATCIENGKKITVLAVGNKEKNVFDYSKGDEYVSFKQNTEEQNLSLYVKSPDEDDAYSFRFMAYASPQEYYKPNELQQRTEGGSQTASFRNAVQKYKKEGKNEFQKFVFLNKVWNDIEEERSLNFEKAPIIIIGAEKDELEFAKTLSRQIIYTS